METETIKQKRNYGIDLLRIVSMLMVVILHVLGQGGILKSLGDTVTAKYAVCWFLEAASMCAVNCYALISGYVGVSSNPNKKYKNIFRLYLNVIFYTVLISAYFRMFVPDTTSWTYVLHSFLPFWYNTYWYYTAYFCLSFFMTYINIMIINLDKKKMAVLIVTIAVFFSIAPVVFWKDFYFEKNGYSFLWLSIMYVIGGCLRKMNLAEKFKKWQLALSYLLPVTIAWISKIIITANRVQEVNSELLLVYVSPCMMLASVALVLLFSKITIKRKTSIKLVKLFAASSFSVYLIHVHPLIWRYVVYGCTKFMVGFPTGGLIVAVLGISVGIYIVCSCIDFVRIGIFKVIGNSIARVLELCRRKVDI